MCTVHDADVQQLRQRVTTRAFPRNCIDYYAESGNQNGYFGLKTVISHKYHGCSQLEEEGHIWVRNYIARVLSVFFPHTHKMLNYHIRLTDRCHLHWVPSTRQKNQKNFSTLVFVYWNASIVWNIKFYLSNASSISVI